LERLPEPSARVLRAIIHLYEKGGVMPTYREIEHETKLSRGGVLRQVSNLLNRRFLLAGEKRAARSLKILLNPDGTPYAPRGVFPAAITKPSFHGDVSAGNGVEPGPAAAYGVPLAPPPVGDYEVIVLTRDDLAHHAVKGDRVTVERREPEPGEWCVDGRPVVRLERGRCQFG
jgi:hypothetical protein